MALHGVDIGRLTEEQNGEVLEDAWDAATDEQRAKVLRRFLNSSKNKDSEVHEEVVAEARAIGMVE